MLALGNPAQPTGYTSKYIDVDVTPEYPFGYGLSYTTFEYSAPKLSSATMGSRDKLTVTAEIVNTVKRSPGDIAGNIARRLTGEESATVSFHVHDRGTRRQTGAPTLVPAGSLSRRAGG